MNPYADILSTAAEEIRAFAATEEGRRWESQWYDRVLSLVDKVRIQPTTSEAERYLDMVMWAIVDSGPLGKGFGPSIDRAADAMQRRRKQEFKERRLSK